MQRTTWFAALALASGACLAIWSLGAWSDRETVLRAAHDNLAGTARLLEQHADRAFEAADRAVQAVVAAAGDLAGAATHDGAARLHETLRTVGQGSPQIAAAWVLDRSGQVVADSRSHPPATPGSVAGHDDVPAHPAGETGLAIGAPGLGPSGQQPRFTLSRPLRDAAGELVGIAAVAVLAGDLGDAFAEAGLGAGARFALLRRDGSLLAAAPDAPGGGMAGPGEDGRIAALRHLARVPVLIEVSQARAEALAEWRARTLRSGLVLGVLLGALLALTRVGLRGARQQRALTLALQAERGALERRVAERTAKLAESEARFREMADNAPVMVWVSDPAGAFTFLSRSWYGVTGQDPRSGLARGWLDAVHPADRPKVVEALARGTAAQAPFRLELRLRAAGGTGWRWALAVAAPRRRPGGLFLGHIGSIVDITDRREAEERQELMARELDHRAKNALTVVQAALRLTPKHDAAAYAAAVEGRVAALARAHSALAERHWQGVALRTLVEGELAAFLPAGVGAAPRAAVEGPDVLLVPAAVQALSMALHELATNAVKHGALGVPTGRLSVTWRLDRPAGLLRLTWQERGGPPLAGAPARRGFGTRVIEATLAGQLGGRSERAWEEGGLVLRLDLPLARVLSGVAGPEPEVPDTGRALAALAR